MNFGAEVQKVVSNHIASMDALDKLGAEAVHDAKEAISPLFEAVKEGDENE